MSLSRRQRFEILRRDSYTCHYCGARAPDVTLTVDHVIPIALGGSDDGRNLVTACADCNAGKASINPDEPLVAEVDATALLFRGAVERVAADRRADRTAMRSRIEGFDALWQRYPNDHDGGTVLRDANWQHTIERFVELGLDLDDLAHYIGVAMTAITHGAAWKYFCGCCWRELTTRQELARQMIEDGDV